MSKVSPSKPYKVTNCPSEKKRFKSSDHAKDVLTKIRYTSNSGRIPIRYYFCHFCKGYHLTSRVEII